PLALPPPICHHDLIRPACRPIPPRPATPRWSLMTAVRSVLLAGAALALAGPASLAQADAPTKGKDAPVSYYREVRRLFQPHCQGCHQPAKAMGGYVMTAHADLVKAGDRGAVNVVAGQPDKSFLLEQITPKDGKALMPKGRAPLSAGDL